MNTKKMVIITTVVLCFCLVGIVIASTSTWGGQMQGVKVKQTFKVHQNKYSTYATDLHFKVWQKEDNINVNGWDIDISGFTNSTSQRGNQPSPYNAVDNGQHAVDVVADGASIPYCTYVKIDVDFWLTSYNTIRIHGLNWTKATEVKQAVPNFGWTIDYPTPHPTLPGVFRHRVTITNDDPNNSINLTNIKILPSVSDVNIHDTNVPFGIDSNTIQISNKNLAPGQSCVADVNTVGQYIGNHIYSTFSVNDSNVIVVTDHPVTDVPIPTLSEWGLIIMAGLLLTVGAVVIRQRFKTVPA